MEALNENYINEIQRCQAHCKEREDALHNEGRFDEANLEKVKWNIYDIFTVLYRGDIKRAKDEQEFCLLYEKKFDMIPTSWTARLKNAREHDDAETILIEETKFAVLEEIKSLYQELIKEA